MPSAPSESIEFEVMSGECRWGRMDQAWTRPRAMVPVVKVARLSCTVRPGSNLAIDVTDPVA